VLASNLCDSAVFSTGPKDLSGWSVLQLQSQGRNENNMARNTAREGRRRRVLNEEVLSASNIAVYLDSSQQVIEPGDTPRYGAGANIENHPQVTSFVPRRFRTLSLIALLGLGAGVCAEFTAYYAETLSKLVQVVSPAEITEVFANRLVAWSSAVVLLLAAGYTRLIFSLQRHRVDDYRGRYRVWRTAGWAAIALSLNAVLGGHELVSRCLGNLVEWQFLSANAGWWLVPAALLGGWLLVKLVIDASECRSALAVYLLAIACLTVAGVHSAGWSPAWSANWPDTLSRTLPLSGYTLFLVGSLLFARYVVLDVQGLIERQVPVVAATAERQETQRQAADDSSVGEKEKVVEASDSDWVDGTQPEMGYDEDSDRPLSKAERKRLRKQQNRHRAA